MRRPLALAAAALAVAGILGCSDTSSPEASDTHAHLTDERSRCGSVTYPRDGAPGTVVIDTGDVDCAEAVAVIEAYFAVPEDELAGSTSQATIDGWRCVTPTTAAADAAGHDVRCSSGDAAIHVIDQ